MSFKCILCHSLTKDTAVYGDVWESDSLQVHYYCCVSVFLWLFKKNRCNPVLFQLLGPNLVNRGESEDDVMGFLNHDIRKEERRIKNQVFSNFSKWKSIISIQRIFLELCLLQIKTCKSFLCSQNMQT